MAATELLRAECLLCGTPAPSAPGESYRLAPPYRVVRCRCGFWFLDPRTPEEAILTAYRTGEYFEGPGAGYASYRLQEPTLRRTFARLMRNLAKRGVLGGALLDVGCGPGYLLEEADGFFDERFGVDLSPDAALAAANVADEVWVGGLDAVPAGASFDLITAIQVIEHVYRPGEFLKHIRSLLRPGGHVVLATPDMDGLLRRMMGARWPSFKLPEHVGYYDDNSLRRVLEAAGFSAIERLPYPHSFPLAVILEKLGLSAPAPLRAWPVRVPGTTVAIMGCRGQGR